MSRKPPRSASGGSGSNSPSFDGASDEPTVPTGIKLISVLRLLFDALLGLVGLALLSESPLGVLILVLVVLDVAVVYGLLTLQHWGWTWAVVLGALNVVLTLLPPNASLIGALIGALITMYIVSKKPVYERARSARYGGA